MADVNIDGVVTWLKNWFYDKTEVTQELNAKVNVAQGSGNADKVLITDSGGAVTTGAKNGHEHGSITSDGKIGSTSGLPVKTGTGGALTTGSFGTTSGTFAEGNHNHTGVYAPLSHEQGTGTITNSDTLTNIASLQSSFTTENQSKINRAIDLILGNISSIKALEFVETLPTASASTMGLLYVINESNKINFYYTKDKGSGASPRYEWEKMDTDILDELIINWSDIQNNPFASASPSDYATSTHTHGQVTNDGKITSTAVTVASGDNIVITDASDSSKIKRVANLLASHIKDGTAHSNIGSSANDTQATINTSIDTALGNKITKSSSATGLLRDDGSVDTTTYLSSLPTHTHNTSLLSDTGDLKIQVANNTIANMGYWLNSNMGYKTDDVDWTYSSDGFTNGVKLVSKSDNANGRITLHLKS